MLHNTVEIRSIRRKAEINQLIERHSSYKKNQAFKFMMIKEKSISTDQPLPTIKIKNPKIDDWNILDTT